MEDYTSEDMFPFPPERVDFVIVHVGVLELCSSPFLLFWSKRMKTENQ